MVKGQRVTDTCGSGQQTVNALSLPLENCLFEVLVGIFTLKNIYQYRKCFETDGTVYIAAIINYYQMKGKFQLSTEYKLPLFLILEK